MSRGASKSQEQNRVTTSLRLIGGTDCAPMAAGKYSDLDVSGGARIRKTLCADRDMLIGHDLSVAGNLVVLGNTLLDQLAVTNLLTDSLTVNTIIAGDNPLVIDGNIEVTGNFDVSGTITLSTILAESLTVNTFNANTSSGTINVNGNIDMQCANITNVMALFVHELHGKSPIEVHDELRIVDAPGSAKRITFDKDIIIGDSGTSTNDNGQNILIGKKAYCSAAATQSILMGYYTGARTQAVAIGGGGNVYAFDKSVAVGQSAYSRTKAVAVGYDAYAAQSGISIGYKARSVRIGGYGCICIGSAYQNGYDGAYCYGNYSVAIGGGQSNAARVRGSYSVAIGYGAKCLSGTPLFVSKSISIGSYSTSRNRAICVGSYSTVEPFDINVGNYNNTVNGINVGSDNSITNSGICIGHNNTVTGFLATAVGPQIITASGNFSIAMGLSSKTLTAGSIAVGRYANVAIGTYSVAIGSGSLGSYAARASAANAVAIGTRSNCTQDNSISIGVNSTASATGAIALGTGITANIAGGFFVKHNTGGVGNPAQFVPGTNELVEMISSARYKTNIRDLEDISDKFSQLRPVRYEMKTDNHMEYIGLIAEEVYELFPEFVTLNPDGEISGIAFHLLTSILIKELQAEKTQRLTLESRVVALEQLQTK